MINKKWVETLISSTHFYYPCCSKVCVCPTLKKTIPSEKVRDQQQQGEKIANFIKRKIHVFTEL